MSKFSFLKKCPDISADVNDSVFDYYDNIESEIIKEVSKLKQQNEIKVA